MNSSFQRRLALRIVEAHLDCIRDVPDFNDVMKEWDPETYLEFIHSLVEEAEKTILIEWPQHESNGDQFYSGG